MFPLQLYSSMWTQTESAAFEREPFTKQVWLHWKGLLVAEKIPQLIFLSTFSESEETWLRNLRTDDWRSLAFLHKCLSFPSPQRLIKDRKEKGKNCSWNLWLRRKPSFYFLNVLENSHNVCLPCHGSLNWGCAKILHSNKCHLWSFLRLLSCSN